MSDLVDYSQHRRRGVRRMPISPFGGNVTTFILESVKSLENDLGMLKSMKKEANSKAEKETLKTLINSLKEEVGWRREFLNLQIDKGLYP